MPIKSWIERDKKRIHAIVHGVFSIDDILNTIKRSTKDPDYEVGFDVLSDHTKIERPITVDQLKRMVFRLIELSEFFAGTRLAVVTHNEISKGMMTMLSEYVQRVPMEMRTFTTTDEAEKWLDDKKERPSNTRPEVLSQGKSVDEE